MKELYYLDQAQLPKLPLPHDAEIREISLDSEYLTFVFEDDITVHDGVADQRPNVESLIMRFHLVPYECIDSTRLIVQKKRRSLPRFLLFLNKFRTPATYREVELKNPAKQLPALCKHKLSYLYHFIAYDEIIVNLWTWEFGDVVFNIRTDRIEFDWIEKK